MGFYDRYWVGYVSRIKTRWSFGNRGQPDWFKVKKIILNSFSENRPTVPSGLTFIGRHHPAIGLYVHCTPMFDLVIQSLNATTAAVCFYYHQPSLSPSLSLSVCLCLAPLVLDSQILLLHLSVSRALRLFFFLPAVMGGFRLPLHHGSPDCTQRLEDRWDSKRNWMLRISREWGEIWLRDCCHEISHS